MQHLTHRHWLFALLIVGIAATSARSDLIFFKDGHVVQGTVRREVTDYYDPISRESVTIPKGFFSIDDGPRRIFFSYRQVKIVEQLPKPTEERVIRRGEYYIVNPRPMLPILEVVETSDWDLKKWQRSLFVRTPSNARVGLIQAPAAITPYFIGMVATTKFKWYAAYLTREFDPKSIQELLMAHREFGDEVIPKKGEKKPQPGEKAPPGEIITRRLRLCDFCAQAGWYDLAEKELERLGKDYPVSKGRVADARRMLTSLRLRDDWEQIKHWYQAGRYEAVRKRLAEFPAQNATDQMLIDLRDMKDRIDHLNRVADEARKSLDECIKAADTPRGRSLASAAAVIRSEVHPANAERLDSFLGQVRDAARKKARGKKPAQSNEDLLSLAVSGWLLGTSSAEALPAAAINLWKTRQMLVECMGESDQTARQRILARYEKEVTPRVELDEVAQVIVHLPPIAAQPKPTTQTTAVQVGRGRNGFTYHVKVPPEYTHNRPYPLLMVLHHGDEKATGMLQRWEKLAAEHGYILAAPEWGRGLGTEYEYTEAEHDTVLDTLRDVRKRYQIDSDRVFLFGHGEGGKAALDVGLSHPDLFAGVLPMNSGAERYPRRYWRNGQYLPFYFVSGTRAGETYAQIREMFEHWIPGGFPALWVEYKGRGTEFFTGEMPLMFDWMRHQSRKFPLRQLGASGFGTDAGTEFCTHRPGDNRFYWLGTNNIHARNLLVPPRWTNLASPAALTARIDQASNEISITVKGVSQVTVWLGRNRAGQNQIDFDRPVTVNVNDKGYLVRKKVLPSLAVLVEELYERGDRTQLVLAKIELKLR